MPISNPAFRPVQDARWADLRIQVTAANGDDEIDEIDERCDTLRRLGERFPL